ncbi:MAG: zinc-finger domain-containing protein [Acidobacteria bacterium]|nr:zinc-finger domain-containing protein [Acidobacteriota bacterium]
MSAVERCIFDRKRGARFARVASEFRSAARAVPSDRRPNRPAPAEEQAIQSTSCARRPKDGPHRRRRDYGRASRRCGRLVLLPAGERWRVGRGCADASTSRDASCACTATVHRHHRDERYGYVDFNSTSGDSDRRLAIDGDAAFLRAAISNGRDAGTREACRRDTGKTGGSSACVEACGVGEQVRGPGAAVSARGVERAIHRSV